jgi:hypothetical protein
MPYKVNEKRRHKIPKARYRVQNWREYDAAMAARNPPHSGRRVRPQQYSAIAIETGLMLRLAFGRPWRQTEGMLASILRLLDLDLPVPDHTTFSRGSADLTVAKALSAASGPVNVVIDSTGLKVSGPANGSTRSMVAKDTGPGASSTWPSIPIPVRSSHRS